MNSMVVGMGGFVGAVLRYLIGLVPVNESTVFPVKTFAIKMVKDDALLDKVRESMPEIMSMYDKNGWEMALFYLENGHAEIRGMMDLKEEFDV